MLKCQTKLCDFKTKEELRLFFKNIYGHEPTSEELKVFESYLRSVGKWK